MATDDKIINEKLKHDIKREALKITTSFSSKTDKYKYLTGILLSNQNQMLQQAKFRYCLSGKAFEKQTNKQVVVTKSLNLSNKINELSQIKNIFLQNQLNDFITDKLKEVKRLHNNINKMI